MSGYLSSKGYCNLLLFSLFLSANLYAESVADKIIKEAYLLGPEDKLHISVWKEEDLDSVVVVRPDGRISFPLVGEIYVAGKDVEYLRKEVTKRIRKYIPEAIASVSMEQVAGYRVYVLGKVKRPGQHILGSYVDVAQALTLSGGLTPYATEDGIKVIRRINGSKQVFAFNYEDIKGGKSLGQNIILQSGDIVVVP